MKILFPTDFSEAANNAYVYALSIADKLKAEILTIHVFERPDIRALHLPRTLSEVYESMALEEFDEYRKHIAGLHRLAEKEGHAHIPVKHMLAEGTVKNQIIAAAKREKTAFIVMGTKGAGWLRQIFTGTVAGEMMEYACCPVLAVPGKAVFDKSIDKIGVTTSFAEEEVDILRKTLDFAAIFNARVYCIHVDQHKGIDPAENEDEFRDQFRDVPNLNFIILEGPNVIKTLSEYIEANDFDVLAMLTHQRSFMEEMIDFSEAKMMSYRYSTPILAFHA
jgi:nucleotide-binding universal stress UspA family protein